ncbi:MAG: hypothetical protein GWO87_02925 [Xanthomonadaceae bacterium]|nr:hypothetical protein [Rhodospirillaceae bacterium]NIA18115.1 hypothetical protein [Xanthomonadaceae bacterium]
MHYDKWQNIIAMIEEKFGILDKKEEQEEIGKDVNGKDVFEKKEKIEFNGPLGKMKLELITRPIVLEKKTNFSRRIGGDVGIEYIYSDSEESSRFKAYQWSKEQNDWLEINSDMFAD